MHGRTGLVCILAGALLAACGGGDKEPIKIGLAHSATGFDAPFGAVALTVTQGAVDDINDKGGIDGHELQLIVADDGSESADAPRTAQIAFDELLAEGVVAIVGPSLSGQLATVIDDIAAAGVPTLTPSATNPSLTAEPDDGFMMRTTPNDAKQVLAIRHYLQNLATPAVTDILIVHEEGSYGEGLATALRDEWQSSGFSETASPVAYPTGLDANPSAVDTAWSAILAANPSQVVVISVGADANALVRKWVDSGELPDLRWFFTDAVKTSSFFGEGATALPLEASRMRGTAPTYPSDGLAFRYFVDVLEDDIATIANEGYMPNYWDAAYLIAGGLLVQAAEGEEFGGAGLRDAILGFSRDGQIVDAGDWREISIQIDNGNDVDYDGASGPVNLDADGETISPYEVWEAQNLSGSWNFSQVEYIDTADLEP